MGLLDWLGINGGGAPGLAPNELEYVQSQGFSPTPNPLTGNRQAALQGLWSGLSQLGAGLAAAGARRPVGSPGPTIGQAFSGVGPAVQQGTAIARQQSQMERQQQEEEQWRRLAAQDPILAQLPMSVGQHVLSARLSREPRDPPDPRRNFITTRNGIFDVSSGTPVPVGGTGGGGGAGATATGGPFRPTSVEGQSLNILISGNPASPEYAAVYAREAAPRMQTAPDANGNLVASWVHPDMSAYRPPTFRHPQPGQAQATAPADPTGYVAAGAPAPTDAAPPTVQSLAAPVAQAAPQQPGSPRIQPLGPPRPNPTATEAVRRFENESTRVLDAVNNFERLANAAGPGTRFNAWIENPTDPAAAEIQQAYNNMVTTLRSEAFLNTGVLQPAEMSMIRNMMRDPTSWRGALTTPEARTAQLNQIRQMIQSGIARQRASIQQPGQAAPAVQPGVNPNALQPVNDPPSTRQPGQQAQGTPLPMRTGPDGRQVPDDMRLRDGEIYIAPSGLRGRYNAQRRTFTPVGPDGR